MDGLRAGTALGILLVVGYLGRLLSLLSIGDFSIFVVLGSD